MERLMIYPYSKAYEPYVLYEGLLQIEGEISSLVTPNGSGLVGKWVCYGEKELEISGDYEGQLEQCDAVWFVNDEKFVLSEAMIEEKLQEAVKRGKKILFTRTSVADQGRIEEMIPTEQNMSCLGKNIGKDSLDVDYCHPIDTPVLVVYGTERDTDKLAVQLALREELIRRGYRTASISSRMDGGLYGMYPMPAYMLKPMCSEGDKIRKYNHYVRQIELEEQPEILIVGIPGGVLPYDRVDHNDYGILAYEISFAVPCDAAIVCIPYQFSIDGDYSEFVREVDLVFRYHTIGCHIAASVPDTQTVYENRKRHLVCLNRKFVESKVKEYGKKDAFHIVSREGASDCVQLILNELSAGA